MKETILGLLMVFAFGFSLQGQIGHVDIDAIKGEMPEMVTAMSELESYKASFRNEGDAMIREWEKKYNVMCGAPFSDSEIAKLKLEEDSIILFEAHMLSMVQIKKAELFNPIQEKIDFTLKEVAIENKFEAILDQGSAMILFSDPASDIKILVQKKLGLQVQPNVVDDEKFAFNLQAQKIGHLNLASIKSEMSELTEAKTELKAYGVELQKQQQEMIADLRKDHNRLLKYGGHFSNNKEEAMVAKLKIKENEILLFDSRMESMIKNKESELLRPIHDKIDAAIKAVAIENEFQYILDESSTAILFNDSTDVSALVMVKLGM